MAGKNQVTLTFAGDAKPLQQSTTEVDDSLNRVGDAADEAKDRMSRMQRLAGEGGRAFGDYGKGIGGVGDRFDELDTRAMGTADGITGVSDLMRHGELSAAEYAMALSDIGSSMYNTVIPSLQSAAKNGGDWLKQMTGAPTTLRAVGRAAVLTAGAAGLGALVFAIDAADKAARAAAVDRLTEQIVELGRADFSPIELMRGDLNEAFDAALTQSPEAARQFIAWADSIGFTREKTNEWRAEVRAATDQQALLAAETSSTTEAVDAQAASIQALRDQNTALFDPIFAAVNAQRTLAQANRDVVLAVDEHGRSSQEYKDAQWAAIEATVAQDSAIRALAEDVVKNNVDMGTAVGRLEDMAGGSGEAALMTAFFKDEVARLSQNVTNLPGYKQITIDMVWRTSGRSNLELLAGYDPTYAATLAMDGRATGGGMPGGWIGEVGEQGKEIMAIARGYTGHVWTPSQFGQFMGAVPSGDALDGLQYDSSGGGGVTINNVNVAGSVISERRLFALMRGELDRGGLRS